jgi:iron complex outermembrane receptor protein
VKYASYTQDFVHAQDNGKGVGLLGGAKGPVVNKITTSAVGGAGSLSNSVTYTDWLPSLDLHYKIKPNWSTYAQYSIGDQIPSTSVFDVPNAKANPVPKATKSSAMQVGTVWNSDGYTFAADIYSTKLDGAYNALPADAQGNVGYVFSGTEVSQGIEVESNIVLGSGFSLYLNGTVGSVKYDNGQWVSGAPQDTETIAVSYQYKQWDVNLAANRVGRMYNDAADGSHEAFSIDPVVLTNLFVNYTVKSPSKQVKKAKLQLGVNNLFDKHDIIGIASPVGASANPADLLTVLPGRSINATLTVDF